MRASEPEGWLSLRDPVLISTHGEVAASGAAMPFPWRPGPCSATWPSPGCLLRRCGTAARMSRRSATTFHMARSVPVRARHGQIGQRRSGVYGGGSGDGP